MTMILLLNTQLMFALFPRYWPVWLGLAPAVLILACALAGVGRPMARGALVAAAGGMMLADYPLATQVAVMMRYGVRAGQVPVEVPMPVLYTVTASLCIAFGAVMIGHALVARRTPALPTWSVR